MRADPVGSGGTIQSPLLDDDRYVRKAAYLSCEVKQEDGATALAFSAKAVICAYMPSWHRKIMSRSRGERRGLYPRCAGHKRTVGKVSAPLIRAADV